MRGSAVVTAATALLLLLPACCALSATEQLVLADVYNSTLGSGWVNNTGWGGAALSCSAFGVACSPSGALTGLFLSGNGLAGTFPQSLCSAPALATLDVRLNMIQGLLPTLTGAWRLLTLLPSPRSDACQPALAGCSALTAALLGDNLFRGTIPAALGLPPLTSLDLSGLFIHGDVPPSFAVNASRWGSSGLVLARSLLNGATLPPALCPLVCTFVQAFTCPSGVATACPAQAANFSCALQQCIYNACPLPALPDSALASVSRSCATPSLAASCSTCLTTLVLYFEQAGVTRGEDVVGCIQLYAPVFIVEGASVNALQLLTQCGNSVPGSIASVQCPTVLPAAQLQEIAAGCSSLNQVCTTCGLASVNAFEQVGLFSASDPLVYQFLLAYSCSSKLAVQLYSAGFPVSVFFAAQGCAGALQVPLAITAVLVLSGVSTLTFAGAPVIAALAVALGADVQTVMIVDAVDTSRGLNVTFKIFPNTTSEQQVILTSMANPAAARAMVSVLLANGAPAAAVSFSLVSALGPAPGPTATAAPPAVRLSSGAIAGVVVGVVVGAGVGAYLVFTVGRRSGGCPDGKWSLFGSLRSTSSDTKSGSQSDTASTGSQRAMSAGGSMDAGWTSSSADVKGDTKSLLKVEASELQLDAICGMGFMGTVYSASWRGVPVAVKVFKADVTVALGLQSMPTADLPGSIAIVTDKGGFTGSHTSSFLSELEMLSSVRHPNILACYAFVVGPPAMLVVELGTAGSLKDLLARTTLAELPWRRRLELCAGVAAGVEFLHSLTPQLIHGDLKSANIVLDGLLVPKIADFGLSFLATGAATRIGKGTPAYCAPEVARGEPIANEPAIDVYGLGCILNDVAHVNTDDDAPRRLRAEGLPSGDKALTEVGTLETRARLFDGDAKAIHIMVSREAANYEPEVARRVPASIRAIILAMLATQPDARPSAGAVRKQMLAASQGPLQGG